MVLIREIVELGYIYHIKIGICKESTDLTVNSLTSTASQVYTSTVFWPILFPLFESAVLANFDIWKGKYDFIALVLIFYYLD